MKLRHSCDSFKCRVCSPATAKAWEAGLKTSSDEAERLYQKLEECRAENEALKRDVPSGFAMTAKRIEQERDELREENKRYKYEPCPQCGYTGCKRGRKACDDEIAALNAQLAESQAECARLRSALENIKEREKPGVYDNDPLGMGIVSPSFRVAADALSASPEPALLRELEALRRLEEVMEYYANPETYKGRCDNEPCTCGQRARDALAAVARAREG